MFASADFRYQISDIYFVKDSGTGKSLRALLEEIRNDKKIRSGITPQDAMPWMRVISHAQDEIISYAKQYRVPVNQIDEKVTESINISGMLIICSSHATGIFLLLFVDLG